MPHQIFLFHEHLPAETLRDIWLEANPESAGDLQNHAKQGTRGVDEIFKIVLDNSDMLIAFMGSFLAAWKLWQDGRKNKLEADKLELDKKKFELETEKFRLEMEKLRQEVKKIELQNPKTVTIRQEGGSDIVLPLELDDSEKTMALLEEELTLRQLENVKGIIFE